VKVIPSHSTTTVKVKSLVSVKLLSQRNIQFLKFFLLNCWTTICCLFYNFVRWVTIVGTHHHAKNIKTTTRPLEMLHINLSGPVAYISIGGNKYDLVIIDDYSRFTYVFFL
jgi:hypothetical protein